YKKVTENTGTGSDVQRAITAATAAVSGLAGGNLNAALAGAAAPYIANEIGKNITDQNTTAGIMAHAVVNAVLAKVQGQNALIGASGAVVGEAMGILIAKEVYKKDPSQLNDTEKQTVAALSTLASGLAGALAGNNTEATATAAKAGQTTVENNLLGGSEDAQAAWIRQHGIDMATCSDNANGAACQKAINERDAVGLALATGTVALLPGSAQAMWGLGASANAGISYLADGTIDPANAAIAGWVNVFSKGNGLAGTVGWNAAGGALGNWIDNKDPLSGALINGAGSGIGYGVGKIIQRPLENVINPGWKNWEWIDIGKGVSKPLPLNPAPEISGNIGSSVGSEGAGVILQEQVKSQQEQKK
ncbi:VENN motif pre-toxin domain-containing protein, partial [Cronobacter sakazakii]|nr:VENN motif pre-toxin domain-containing protein [Cronobacter sakazakii]